MEVDQPKGTEVVRDAIRKMKVCSHSDSSVAKTQQTVISFLFS